MTGQELGGRYELMDRIGGGGMALVYKAHDILLNRYVAVKVLRQQYVHDEEFIRRFRREAQAAASLSHPNVVSIYDVGQQEDVHYIVMEYVEGMNLNDLIKEKAPMQVEEALHIAAQICEALDHAHANQIVHRDIKPHNILIGRNGRIKVTDFGIARATTSSTITQTGSVVGSVHYFSPEHAKGTPAGAKSDLYSLGIVLYQMLTGRLPFLGESPISVALKHLQENVEEPRSVNPLIPQSVENIILKAMRKSPEERYQSAREMLDDLETCMLPERRNERKIVFPDDGHLDEERTRVIPAIRPDSYDGGDDDEEEETGKRKRAWIAPTVWGVVLLLTIGILWYGVGYLKSNFAPKDVAVPSVEGRNVVDAKKMITDAGLRFEVNTEPNKEVAKDIVLRQDPKGMSVREGTLIRLYVSSGAEMRVMPNYVGKMWSDVKLELLAIGVNENNQIKVDEAFSDEDQGKIIQQQPKPDEQFDPAKAQFVFTVSKGKEMLKMPDLIGMTQKEAENQLAMLDLKLAPNGAGVIKKPSFDQPKDRVYDQFPYKKDQDVARGSAGIVIYVSTGMPDNAVQYPVQSQTLNPKTAGKASSFRIVLTDARYDGFELKTLEVSSPRVIDIQVTLTPDKSASIQYYRDNELYNTQTVTYQDYLAQKNKPSSSPGSSVSPSATPSPNVSNKPGTSASPSPSAGGR